MGRVKERSREVESKQDHWLPFPSCSEVTGNKKLL
jgi:hypothetical protein